MALRLLVFTLVGMYAKTVSPIVLDPPMIVSDSHQNPAKIAPIEVR